jgi:hypothetical protein
MFPALFPENMQHVNRVPQPRDVQQPVFALDMDSDFIYTGPNRRHRLPVAWLHIVLDQFQFVARLLPNGFGERSYSLEAVAHPLNRFEGLPHLLQYTRLCISTLSGSHAILVGYRFRPRPMG